MLGQSKSLTQKTLNARSPYSVSVLLRNTKANSRVPEFVPNGKDKQVIIASSLPVAVSAVEVTA